ncbi:hypothetical protein F5050DRAFT_134107 [Lentinula boryana]|uniref:Zinc-finger domain-containing protein n=1 Tax=Lentinula boryana TaxID=40481 RepID=A0ABQ8QCR4_9AGAR|nr:hypothetical protein F5050DRAFT_134107 [Lentinula boryana]
MLDQSRHKPNPGSIVTSPVHERKFSALPPSQNSALNSQIEDIENSDSEDIALNDVPAHTGAFASISPDIGQAALVPTATRLERRKTTTTTTDHEGDVIEIDSGSELQSDDEGSPKSRISRSRPSRAHEEVNSSAALESDEHESASASPIGPQKAKGKEKKRQNGKTDWPKSGSYDTCHQCRQGSHKLHMCCANCPVKYCVMCITNHYSDILSFDRARKDFVCFRCEGTCRCIACRRKRETASIPPQPGAASQRSVRKAASHDSNSPLTDLCESIQVKTVTERRPRRGLKTNGKDKKLELEMEDEDGTVISSSQSKTVGKRREGREKAQGKKKVKPEAAMESETDMDVDADMKHETKNAKVISSKRSDWPEGALEYYCHQCRCKSHRLFMGCASKGCKMKYCIRCVTSRYANVVTFDSNRKDVCFRCKDTCNCDICCRKRGDTYIPSKGPTSQIRVAVTARSDSRQLSGKISTKVSPSLTIDTQISEPVVYWGAIYNRAGEEIAAAYVTSVENDEIIFARPTSPNSGFRQRSAH